MDTELTSTTAEPENWTGARSTGDAHTAPRPASAAAGRLVSYALAIIIAVMWGASFVLTKAALGWIGPFGIAFVRWAISAIVLVGWIALRRRLRPAGQLMRTDGWRVFWLALSGIALFYALENLSVTLTTATNAGILANLTSVFMVLMGVAWFGERLTAVEWLALGISFVGAVLVSQGSGHFDVAGAGLRGDLLMMLATVFAALYSVGSKRLTDRYPADVVMAVVAVAGAVMLLPMALYEGMNLALPMGVWVALLVLGLGAGALANLWWLYLLSFMDASRVGMFLFLVPVFTAAMAAIYLHEALPPMALVGGVLVLAGVWAMRGKAQG